MQKLFILSVAILLQGCFHFGSEEDIDQQLIEDSSTTKTKGKYTAWTLSVGKTKINNPPRKYKFKLDKTSYICQLDVRSAVKDITQEPRRFITCKKPGTEVQIMANCKKRSKDTSHIAFIEPELPLTVLYIGCERTNNKKMTQPSKKSPKQPKKLKKPIKKSSPLRIDNSPDVKEAPQKASPKLKEEKDPKELDSKGKAAKSARKKTLSKKRIGHH